MKNKNGRDVGDKKKKTEVKTQVQRKQRPTLKGWVLWTKTQEDQEFILLPQCLAQSLPLPASPLCTSHNPGLDQPWCCGHDTKNGNLFPQPLNYTFTKLLYLPSSFGEDTKAHLTTSHSRGSHENCSACFWKAFWRLWGWREETSKRVTSTGQNRKLRHGDVTCLM